MHSIPQSLQAGLKRIHDEHAGKALDSASPKVKEAIKRSIDTMKLIEEIASEFETFGNNAEYVAKWRANFIRWDF